MLFAISSMNTEQYMSASRSLRCLSSMPRTSSSVASAITLCFIFVAPSSIRFLLLLA